MLWSPLQTPEVDVLLGSAEGCGGLLCPMIETTRPVFAIYESHVHHEYGPTIHNVDCRSCEKLKCISPDPQRHSAKHATYMI